MQQPSRKGALWGPDASPLAGMPELPLRGVEGLTPEMIRAEIRRGGRFIRFEYCVSIILVTFWHQSDAYLLRHGERSLRLAAPYILLTFFLGWWGIPWGPVRTVIALVRDFRGGVDVTNDVMIAVDALNARPA